MNKKNEVLTNLELSSFCKQMSMILKAGISPIEGISMMIEDSQNKNEKQDPMESEADVVKPDVNPGNHSMQNDNEDETHKKTKRVRRKTTLLAEIPSESNSVPSTILRKFYANNFTIKPEKIFFMDDDAVKEKIDEKYIVLVRENDYLFLKKNTSIISVAKD
mgnify:CR=1 FL=1